MALLKLPRNTIRRMTHSIRARIATIMTMALAAAATALLGGCGGTTKTVSVAGSPTSSQTTATTTTSTTGAATTPARTSTGTTNGGGASGGAPATSTRTATAPAFAEKGKGAAAEGLPAALAVVRAHGYTAHNTSDYHPDQTLRVLVATGTGSNDGYNKQAFFFLDGRYLGTDASRPSAQISVVSQSDTEVTLAYQLYRPKDPLCCPGGGTAHVHFQLNNGRLVPLDPIPPVSSASGTSRQ
jgi:LppP/LprE lipoprotein